MFHHRLWYWRWSWGRLWLFVWHPCRQECKVPSGRRSAILAKISQKCVSFRLSAKVHWTVPYDSPTTSKTLRIVCLQSARTPSQTFATFSGVVLVDSHPECSSSLTDVRPSLKRLYHKKALFWHMALSPKASCSTGWVSAAVFFKIETKFDADYLLPKIGHISCKKIHRITKT